MKDLYQLTYKGFYEFNIYTFTPKGNFNNAFVFIYNHNITFNRAQMKVSVNRTAMVKNKEKVFTVEDFKFFKGDIKQLDFVVEGSVVASLKYTPEKPAKSGARAYLEIYEPKFFEII